MNDPGASGQDGKLDLVPMIDCIMLLLLFFILTTDFNSAATVLAAVLPTTQGNSHPTSKPPPIQEPHQINLVAYPDGMQAGLQPSQYLVQLNRLRAVEGDVLPAALLRIGGSEPLRIDGAILGEHGTAALAAQLADIHAYIASELRQREVGGVRSEQTPIDIHCFSGLPWKYAVVIYDAVRAYEKTRTVSIAEDDDPTLANARPVTFAPPLAHNYKAGELGEELYEIVNLH